jgi:hypothetical protein
MEGPVCGAQALMNAANQVVYEISTSAFPRRYFPNPCNVVFYWITENRRVEIIMLADYICNLHEEDQWEVIVYVTVDDWELEILFRSLITHPTTP